MQAVTFSTRQDTAKLLLIGSGKVESRQIGTCVDLFSSYADEFISARYYLINRFVGVNVLMGLIRIADTYGFSYLE